MLTIKGLIKLAVLYPRIHSLNDDRVFK